MSIRYFILDPADYSGASLNVLSGSVGVLGSVSDVVFSNVRISGGMALADPGLTGITWSDGSQVTIESQAVSYDSAGNNKVDPVLDGSVQPLALETVVAMKLANGYIILLERTGSPALVDLDGETPEAFVFIQSMTVSSSGSFGYGTATLEEAFAGSFGSAPVCFGAGTRIATPGGFALVEALRSGDLVLTDDGAVLPVLWAGGRRLSGAVLAANPKWAPIRIAPGALGPGVPARPLVLSPQHRVLLAGPMTLRHGGQAPVLAPARGLLGLPGVREVFPANGISYHHLLLPRHAVLLAEGAPAESLLPTQRALASLSPAQRAEVRALIARHRLTPEPAHPCLRVGDVRGMLPRRFDGPAGAASRLARRGAVLDGAA